MVIDISYLKPSALPYSQLEEKDALQATEVYSYFENAYPEELTMLELTGVHPFKKQKSIYDPFNYEYCTDDFTNVGHHCLAVATCTLLLGRLLLNENKISQKVLREAVRRAILHDAIKPYEAFLGKAFQSNKITRNEYYSLDIFDRVKETLTKAGLSESDAVYLVDDIGTETNVRECFHLLWILNGKDITLCKDRFEAKLVHLADNMTCSPPFSKTVRPIAHFLTTWERLVAADSAARYPWAEISGLAAQENQLIYMENIHVTEKGLTPLLCFHDSLIWTSHQICKEICYITGSSEEKSPDEVLKNKVIESLSDFYH